jgi:hypothetical protein
MPGARNLAECDIGFGFVDAPLAGHLGFFRGVCLLAGKSSPSY